MTKKDYIRLAAAIQQAGRHIPLHESAHQAHELTARAIAQALADESATFDTRRFLAACGLED